MRPDITGIDRCFDYAVPHSWRRDKRAASLEVGSRVRVDLHGRRVAAWVVDIDPAPATDLSLLDLQRWSGLGPSADVVELADWASMRWLGSPVHFLRTASPPRVVPSLRPGGIVRFGGVVEPWAAEAVTGAGASLRLGPAADRWPLVLAAAAVGNPLFLVPTVELATQLAGRLRRAGLTVALLPDDWAVAAAGAIAVGTRAAIFARLRDPGAIVVFDEHDEAYREARAPTWNASEVAVERAARLGVPCVLVSPCLTATAVNLLPTVARDRVTEHGQWPQVDLVDRRDEPPGRRGLFSERLVRSLRGEGRVACILNRVGRVRLLACVACGELTVCAGCGANVEKTDDGSLSCPRCAAQRPPACSACGGARLKNLVLGIGRAREELEALLAEPVGEVTAEEETNGHARVVIGTEALLRRRPAKGKRWRTVAFLDFDQHLGSARQTAEVEAASILVLAARHVGDRRGSGRVLVQTRQPEHRVLSAIGRGNTGPLTTAWTDQAAEMRWPPAVGQAQVSGPGAAGFIDRLGNPIGLEVLGPADDQWLIRASDIATLTRELSRVDRGSERLRVAVV